MINIIMKKIKQFSLFKLPFLSCVFLTNLVTKYNLALKFITTYLVKFLTSISHYFRWVNLRVISDLRNKKMSRVTRWFVANTYYPILYYYNPLRGNILLMYKTINLITPILFSFTVTLGSNLELTIPTVFEMNSSDITIPSSSIAGSSTVIDLTGDNNGNIEKPWIDLKLVKHYGDFYVVDDIQKNGANLIDRLEPQAGQEKPVLVTLNTSSRYFQGFRLELDGSAKISTMYFEGKKYQGHYVDLKFSNATITSYKIPIQKNDNGSFFIVWKKVSK